MSCFLFIAFYFSSSLLCLNYEILLRHQDPQSVDPMPTLSMLLPQGVGTWDLLFPPKHLQGSLLQGFAPASSFATIFLLKVPLPQYCCSIWIICLNVLITKIRPIFLFTYSPGMEALWGQGILFTIAQCLEQCLAHAWLSMFVAENDMLRLHFEPRSVGLESSSFPLFCVLSR